MRSSIRIIVTGLIAQHRLLGGVAWDYLNFMLGLSLLDHDVYYFEDSGEWPYNYDGGSSGNDWVAWDSTPNVRYLAKVMSSFGFDQKWAYHFPIRREWFGLSDSKRKEIINSADILINISGTLAKPKNYRKINRLVYIDTDPVFTQVRLTKGEVRLTNRVKAHDIHFTVGECMGENIQSTDVVWHPTKHPIALSEWAASKQYRNVITTVMNWTSYKPLKYKGTTYGQKDAEFIHFLELPSKIAPIKVELALGKIDHVAWQTQHEGFSGEMSQVLAVKKKLTTRDLLNSNGWSVVDASEVCPDFDSYRRYIQSSKAEWAVAKNGYVRGKSGWFSGRSACYLATGRPVIVQDTGFSSIIPCGKGIMSFNTIDEAKEAIENVSHNYRSHARAASELANEYFDSRKVLERLLDKSFA
jgi:hypothetical protein